MSYLTVALQALLSLLLDKETKVYKTETNISVNIL